MFDRKGFTLLELLTVVVILSVLSTVAIFSYKKYTQRARVQEGVAFLMDLKMKQETYFQTYSQYIDTGDDADDFYPASFTADTIPVAWQIDCPDDAATYPGWCALNARPSAPETYFQYVSIGWQPGDAAPGNDPDGNPYIPDATRRWWFARARTFLSKDSTRILELRLTSQLSTIREIWPE